MKFYEMLLAGCASVICAFASSNVEELRFVEISGASKGISFESFAISDSNALTLSTNGSVALVGPSPQLLQFGIETSSSPSSLVGIRSIAADRDFFIVGGDSGSLAIGRLSRSGIEWQRTSVGATNNINRIALIGSNLVAITGGRKTFYGPTRNLTNSLNSFGLSDIQAGSFIESYVNVVGFSDGSGAIVGYGGVIRYSYNGGATFVVARPHGSSKFAVTDAAKVGDKLYVTTTDGNILSSTIPSDLSKSPNGWNWQSFNVSGTKPLRSIAAHYNQLVAVGDGGAVFRFSGSNWSPLENLPPAAKSADLIGVKTSTEGEFAGTVAIASKSSIFLGTTVPQPVLVIRSTNGITDRIETCCDNLGTNSFKVSSGAFTKVDWFSGGQRFRTNSANLEPFEKRPGTHKYQAAARDYRSGVESALVEVTHVAYPNPEAPTVENSEVEACVSEGTATLVVKPGPPGIIFRWYSAADPLTNVAEGLRFVVPTTTNAVYFVEAEDTNHVTLRCRSTNRTQISLTVHANPLAPVALQSRVEQCAGDAAVALEVKGGDGVRFEWFTAANGGEKIGDGAAFVPTNRVSAIYYVESVDTTHSTNCRSVTRTPVELVVNPLPDAPKLVTSQLSIATCEDLPTLEVQAISGIRYLWYTSATGDELVSTNATFTPTEKKTKTYFVQAASENTGCLSAQRTPVELTVRPVIELKPQDVIVRHGDTNTSVVLKVGMTPEYKNYHTSSWRSMGDGQFTDANSFSTTYVPGTNDLANGIVKVNLTVVDSGLLCSSKVADVRIIYAKAPPGLKISMDEKGGVLISWTPAPGYQLVASESLSMTDRLVVSDGEAGSFTIPAAEGIRFYRLIGQ